MIGVVLGLVGGGGSILTVPLMHYLFGVSMLLATTYSLFVVAVASGIGTIQKTRNGHVDVRRGIVFVIPSMLTALLIRGWVLPSIPKEFEWFGRELLRENIIAFLLVVVMLYTALKTLFISGSKKARSSTPFRVVLFGILTGLLSGFIGAGGGFIIIPILLGFGMTMTSAVGTSMFIVSIQSSVALTGDVLNPQIWEEGIDGLLLIAITGFTVGGVFLGNYLQRFFSGEGLRKIFSIILIFIAVGMALQKWVL